MEIRNSLLFRKQRKMEFRKNIYSGILVRLRLDGTIKEASLLPIRLITKIALMDARIILET
jgi:hypothetical protein